jgi:hypothetical protein
MFRSILIRGQSAIILETLKQRIITVISFHITTNKVCYREVDMALACPSAPTSTSTQWALVTYSSSRVKLGTVGG